MTKKKNNKQRLVESLNEAINPKSRVDRFAVTQSLLGNYRQPGNTSVLAEAPLAIEATNTESHTPNREKDTLPTLPTLPTYSTEATVKKLNPTAPERDFSKVANSIVRVAISDGWFIGKSKQIYDYIYSVTRGSIKPSRSIRLTKPELMKGSDCRAEKSLMRNIAHLKQIGLLKVTIHNGERAGNEYEILLPEEINLPTLPTLPNLRSKVGQVGTVESRVGRVGQTVENIEQNSLLRLSLKTNTNDDDVFSTFNSKLSEAAKEITGKKLSKREKANLEKLADLLVLELRIASRRTGTVSNPIAFLTEVLRRKLRDTPITKSSKIKVDTVGKSDIETFEIKPLDEKGKELALIQIQEFANDDFLEDFKKWYTKEDWKWLIEQLKREAASDKN